MKDIYSDIGAISSNAAACVNTDKLSSLRLAAGLPAPALIKSSDRLVLTSVCLSVPPPDGRTRSCQSVAVTTWESAFNQVFDGLRNVFLVVIVICYTAKSAQM